MAEAPAAHEIVVATYNIHGCVGTDKRFDIGRIAAVIEEVGADVVAMQEVGDVRGRGPAGNYATEIGERLGQAVLYQPTMLGGDRAYGNAIDPTSSGDMTSAFAMPMPPAINVASVCWTPLGSDVVPDV